ncbi:Hypothetical protein FKW44_011094 [Caligus rogercresseyi]|uniref:Uncharacterized protein n=1 Tax=Caligus rogercresseyi TaxID=217165 RepID=A0A7T8HHJ2_CALRO|nr:Hypothetical protein FKW44_011094 [Caligus rogercresseyi]
MHTLRGCKPPPSRGPYEPSEADFSRLGWRRGREGFPSTEILRGRRFRHPISQHSDIYWQSRLT